MHLSIIPRMVNPVIMLIYHMSNHKQQAAFEQYSQTKTLRQHFSLKINVTKKKHISQSLTPGCVLSTRGHTSSVSQHNSHDVLENY